MDIVTKYFYAAYGKYITRYRALPLINDMLLPVERRTLLSVYETAKDKYVKSAKVVGYAIGTYHPHADCLSGDTLIYGINGKVRKIEDIYKKGIKELDVLSYDEEKQKIVPAKAHAFRIGQRTKKTYVITLSNGSKLEVTDNHPLFINGSWKHSKDIEVGDVITSARLQKVQEGLYEVPVLKFKNLSECITEVVVNRPRGMVVHHVNKDRQDNRPDNLQVLTRAEHAKIHKENLMDWHDSLKALWEDPENREANKQKNSILMTLVNKKINYFKAFKVLDKIENSGLKLTEDNYNKFRTQVYNAPYIETMIKKGQIKNFEELVYLKDNFKLDTEPAKQVKRNRLQAKKQMKKRTFLNLKDARIKSTYMIIYECFQRYHTLNKETYDKTRLELKRSNSHCYRYNKIANNWTELCKEYSECFLIVTNIKVKEYDTEIPMYDFTVEKYHNMFIVSKDENGTLDLVLSHNSSLYSTMVRYVKNGLIDGQGGFYSYGLTNSPPAAMRYTEVRSNKVIAKLMSLVKYAPWQVLEFEKEPLYIPSPIPVGLIGNDIKYGVAFHRTVYPSYTVKDLFKRLFWLLEPKNHRRYIIKPYLLGCDVLNSEYENLLTKGNGKVTFCARHEVKNKNLHIYGCPISWNKLVKYSNTKKKYLSDLSSDNVHVVLEDTSKEALETIRNTISMDILSVDVNGKVKRTPIDKAILLSYEGYKQALLKKLQEDTLSVSNRITDLEIIRKIKPNVKSCNTVEEVSIKSKISLDDARRVLTKYSASKLVTVNTDITDLQKQLKDYQSKVKKIDNYSLETVTTLYQSIEKDGGKK